MCAPLSSRRLVHGDVHGSHVSFGESTHSKVAAGSFELNVKRAWRGLTSTGPESIVVSNASNAPVHRPRPAGV